MTAQLSLGSLDPARSTMPSEPAIWVDSENTAAGRGPPCAGWECKALGVGTGTGPRSLE